MIRMASLVIFTNTTGEREKAPDVKVALIKLLAQSEILKLKPFYITDHIIRTGEL